MTTVKARRGESKIIAPAYAFRRLTDELSDPPFHDFLGPIAVAANSDGSVVVRLPFRPEFCGRRGTDFYHGGIIASLIDVTAHAAVSIVAGGMVPTVDLRIDYLRPARGIELVASARILAVGRTLGRADVEVTSEDGVVAVGRGVFSTAVLRGSTLEHPQTTKKR